MKYLLFLFVISSIQLSFSQKKPAYQIFKDNGKKVSYKKMMKDLKKSEILFFGELHNDPIAHWMQFEIIDELTQHFEGKISIGFEMFESDQQMLLNDYINGQIKARMFDETESLWPNYKTDYKPIVDYAKSNKIACIATNIPRKYASLVYIKGREVLDSIPSSERGLMCPIDFTVDTSLSQYSMLAQMGMHNGGLNFVYAQAIKDATMAYFINQNWNSSNYFVHLNGSFHTDFYQGIIWYMQQYKPELNYRSISVVNQDDITKLEKEYLHKAHYVICTPNSMTKTH